MPPPGGRVAPVPSRYALRRDVDELAVEFEVDDNTLAGTPAGTGAPGALPADVVPATTAPVVLERFRKDEEDAPPTRSLRALRWGLVPARAQDASGGARTAEVRAKTLLEDPATAEAALLRRCLVPADAWYGSGAGATADGGPGGQDVAVEPADGSVLALAGVYDFWRDPARAPGDPARWLVSFAVVTTAAGAGPEPRPGRVPLVVPRDLRDAWLDPSLDDADDVRSLLAAVPDDLLRSGALRVRPVPPADRGGAPDPGAGEPPRA